VGRTSEELKELQAIKKLLVLQLLRQGLKAMTIADAIGMDRGNFSRLFPVRKLSSEEEVTT
jgi:hypothetical protein